MVMDISVYPLGEYGGNCYIISEKEECIIIDPADCADFILEKLLYLKLKPLALFATHGHFDHVMAAGEIQMTYDIPFYIDKKDMFLIDRLEQTAKHFLGYTPAIIKPKNINFFKDLTFTLSAFRFTLINTPGHTPGGVSFFIPSSPALAGTNSTNSTSILFSGDTLFKQGIGRYDFSYCSKKDLDSSLKKLSKLPKNTIVYPGHGESTIIREEKMLLTR
jgi:hydroxyacylglutathione hydrolase